jgi:hypothetical protein
MNELKSSQLAKLSYIASGLFTIQLAAIEPCTEGIRFKR